MQLTSLEIYGFKSFADRTKFAFDAGITGIVGPNGCGKSNIVDSIRWVLGEQKARYLRSDKMENVIFNGTNARRKANFVEVSLTFENTKNILPTEYATVSITRKLYRTGESEYLINGVKCRLKDIDDLFMDTGISSDSYAIIELKMVDEILTNKDQERRRFFEEAAGISKYKIRKKQTLKKLEETDNDLTRVEDLLAEIEKNMKSLERQAKRTQKYFELKEEYKRISSQYAFLKIQSIKTQQTALEGQMEGLGDELTEVQAQMALKEAKIAELKKQIIDNEQALAESQQELNKHLRLIQEKESQRNVKNERSKYLHQRQTSVMAQIETDKKQLEKLQYEIEMLQTKQEGMAIEVKNAENLKTQLQNELQKAQEANNIQQRKAREAETEYKELETELRGYVREKDMQSVRLKSLESELLRNEEDRTNREGDLDEFVEKSAQLQAEVAELAEQIATLTQKRAAHETALKEAEQLAANLKEEVYKANRVLDAKQNEYNLTKSLVDKLEGFPESVKFLKKNAPQLKNAPLLSDIFACPNEYKPAIEQYLEPYLSYYVVESLQEAVDAIELLTQSSKGRANFFILEELQQFEYQEVIINKKEDIQALLAFTTFDEKYQHLAHLLLGNVYLCENEADIPQQPAENVVYIHKNGKFIRKKYTQSGGSFGLFEGKRLGRAKNLEALSLEIADLNQQLMAQKTQLSEATTLLEELRKIRYDRELEPLNKKHIEKQRDAELLKTREKEHREFLVRVGQRTEGLQQEVTQIQQKLQALTPEIEGTQARLNRLTLDLSEVRELASEATLEVNSISARYNQSNIQMIQAQNGYTNLQRELAQKQEQAANLTTSEAKLRTELATIKADIESLIQSNAQDDEEAILLHEQKKELERLTDVAEQALANTKNLNYLEGEALEKDRKQRDALQGQLQRRKDEWNEIRLQISALQERMSVEFQIEVDSLDASIFPNPVETYSVEVIEPQLLKIRGQVQSFGEINPMAVEAFTEMKERYDFIMQQCKDLREAKQSLLSTIAEIDGVAKEKFLATFHQVRTHFIEVFRSLFTVDDTCDLVLVEPENPLESEIDIIARPKGKRPLTITQLSGGEKTLTAVALLFSIYLIKPAPFCIFDEVDAPLDDANIDKFNNIIRDFSKESQFIIVTHNKRTMASTNVMYGITMEDTGISRVLPVNLETLNLK